MIYKIFSPNNLVKILAFFAQIMASFSKNLITPLVFCEQRNFCRRKLANIAENFDHNIGP
jgi:hypothetical protein